MGESVQITFPPSPEFRRAVVERGWLNDGDYNLDMGWGRLLDGKLDAREHLVRALSNGLEQVAVDGEFVGWFEVERDDDTREVRIVPAFFPAEKGGERYGEVARLALWQLIRREFKAGSYRIAVEVLKRNGALRRFLSTKAGFHQEGERWSSHWLDGQPVDTVSLVLIPPLWKKFKRRWFAKAQRG